MTLIDKAEAQSAVRAYLVNESTEIAQRVEQIIDALPARGVGMKPLEWEESVKGRWIGTPVVKLGDLAFWVFHREDGTFMRATKDGGKLYPTLEAAKDAAQADYEARILAALAPTDAADELASVAAQLPGGAVMDGIKIKPLVWKQAGGDIKEGEGFSAWPDLIHTPVTIYRKRDGWWLNLDCKTHPTLEAAKAAAQADYEARILAALAPTDAAQDDDPECTDCGGTGITYQTERRCACQPTDAAQAREAAARLLLDMLHMRNGAHEGVTKDDAQAMWEAASTRVGYAAVDAFLRSIIGEARP